MREYMRIRRSWITRPEKQHRMTSAEKRRVLFRAILNKGKLGGCADCGELDLDVLDYDHVRGEKVNTVSALFSSGSIESVRAEIAKCEVRCANCHRKITRKREFYAQDLNKL